jgi:hypothetical protein
MNKNQTAIKNQKVLKKLFMINIKIEQKYKKHPQCFLKWI